MGVHDMLWEHGSDNGVAVARHLSQSEHHILLGGAPERIVRAVATHGMRRDDV